MISLLGCFMLIVNGCVECDIYFVFVLFLTTFFLLKNGITALHKAAYGGFKQQEKEEGDRPNIVKMLVEHGSNVDLQDPIVLIFFF